MGDMLNSLLGFNTTNPFTSHAYRQLSKASKPSLDEAVADMIPHLEAMNQKLEAILALLQERETYDPQT